MWSLLLFDWGCFDFFSLVFLILLEYFICILDITFLIVIYHVLYFVMINKGCGVSQTMPGFLSFVDLDHVF